MIDEEATLKKFRYRSTDLLSNSSKSVIKVCDKCGKIKEISKSDYGPLCHSCANKENAIARRGKKQSKEVIEKRLETMRRTGVKAGRKRGSIPHTIIPREIRICECGGCNETFICKINSKKRYINGHYVKSVKGRVQIASTLSESREQRSGSNSPLWKGTSHLIESIRSLFENQNCRKICLKRDDYTCQDCKAEGHGKRGVYLEVDHTRPLALLFQEFLQHYPEFSPIKDLEKLLKLAQTWKPFWDINNGKSLCKKHHNKRRTETIRLIKTFKNKNKIKKEKIMASNLMGIN